MRTDTKAKRRAQIEAAALEVMAERGYDGASMLTIAKTAKASNETLYRWYGDKAGLFLAIVTANTGEIDAALDEILAATLPPQDALPRVAQLMLSLLLGGRAVAVNRAAAADKTGALGQALAQGGRERVFPRLVQLMQAQIDAGLIPHLPPEQAAEWFLSLLVGDLQMRRVTGTLAALSEIEIQDRAKSSLAAFYALCGAAPEFSSSNGV